MKVCTNKLTQPQSDMRRAILNLIHPGDVITGECEFFSNIFTGTSKYEVKLIVTSIYLDQDDINIIIEVLNTDNINKYAYNKVFTSLDTPRFPLINFIYTNEVWMNYINKMKINGKLIDKLLRIE